MLKPTKFQARNRISRALEQIPELQPLNTDTEDFKKWRRNTRIAISHTFGEESPHVEEFRQISFVPYSIIVGDYNDRSTYMNAYRDGMVRAKALLESMIEEIEDYWEDDNSSQPASSTQEMPDQRVSNCVFIVHGRNDGTKNTVARFLGSLELDPVILHEQPNEGRTIVEKFEDYADVGFAVVLCTPDDVGALASDEENLRSRPRQNVILELGFFLGKMGRNRVCALLEGDLEMPSDYAGVLYIPLDATEGWKLTLARELRAVGMKIDMNRL